MPLPLVAVAAITAVTVFSKIKAAEAEAEQLRRKSILLDDSANKVLALNDLNTQFIKEDVRSQQGSAITQFASSGSGVDAGSLADIALKGAREIELRTDMANFEAESRRLEANMLRQNAAETEKAGILEGMLGAVGTSASLFR